MNLPPILYLVNSLLMTMKVLCANLVICILYLSISISYFHIWSHLVVELLRQQLVVPICWANKLWRTNKYFETYLPPSFTFVLLKSPSSKSRIRVYLLLVARDPTTTTHTHINSKEGYFSRILKICPELKLKPVFKKSFEFQSQNLGIKLWSLLFSKFSKIL